MSRRCDCCRRCTFVIGRIVGEDDMPAPDRLLGLKAHIGTLADAALVFDAYGAGTATEFIAWLQPEVDRSWVQDVRTESFRSRPLTP